MEGVYGGLLLSHDMPIWIFGLLNMQFREFLPSKWQSLCSLIHFAFTI